MISFKCSDSVLYGDKIGIVVGKRYGHAIQRQVGRMYDVRIGEEVIKDVAESELAKTNEIN